MRVWQFCVRGGEFKESGKNWVFLEEGPALSVTIPCFCGMGHQVRQRQQLQQVPLKPSLLKADDIMAHSRSEELHISGISISPY